MSKQADSSPVSKANETILLGACAAAITTLIPVGLFQTGITSSLSDPPLRWFDSERITSSKAAHPCGVPDSLLGLASFGTTLFLILSARRSPVAKHLLGLKLTADAGAAAFNASRQVISFGKLCSWCTGTAIAAGVMAFAGRNLIRDSWSSVASLSDRARVRTES